MIRRYQAYNEKRIGILEKFILVTWVIIYPMMVSMYSMLPPLIGLAGYIIITNVNKQRIYALSAMLYLMHLDLNLTLPIFLSIFIIVMVYLFLYSNLKLLIRCRVCLLFALIVMIDLFYYLSLFIYDFVFNSSTVINDMLLAYYIAIDIFIGVML